MAHVQIFNYPLTDMEVAELYYSFTGEAFCKERSAYDLDGNCVVSLNDLSIIAANWLLCGTYPDTWVGTEVGEWDGINKGLLFQHPHCP